MLTILILRINSARGGGGGLRTPALEKRIKNLLIKDFKTLIGKDNQFIFHFPISVKIYIDCRQVHFKFSSGCNSAKYLRSI